MVNSAPEHYDDVIMEAIASQITSLTTVYSTVHSGGDQSKHQSCASLAFVWGIHRGPVNSPHKWPVTRKMFPFDDVIMVCADRMTWHYGYMTAGLLWHDLLSVVAPGILFMTTYVPISDDKFAIMTRSQCGYWVTMSILKKENLTVLWRDRTVTNNASIPQCVTPCCMRISSSAVTWVTSWSTYTYPVVCWSSSPGWDSGSTGKPRRIGLL